jgi:hypothetical protein
MARIKKPKKASAARKRELVNKLEQARAIHSSTSQLRTAIGAALGYQFQGDRDLYTACGYNKNLQFNNYLAKYQRQDLCKTIINAPVFGCWKDAPALTEVGSEDEVTDFEQGWVDLSGRNDLGLLSHLRWADRIAGIGRYAILYLGFDDVTRVEDAAGAVEGSPTRQLLFVTPMTEDNASVNTYVKDASDPRFNLPESYNLKFTNDDGSSESMVAHHTRVLHIMSDDPLEGAVFGTPRLECVFNRFDDLEKIAGGSAEAHWNQGFPGLHFDIRDGDDGGDIDVEDLDDFQDQIEDYVHKATRVLRTQGVDVTPLMAQVANPKGIYDIAIDLIAGATGIPKRILIGSERGELASSQDEKAWADRLMDRRENHINGNILDGLVLLLVNAGIIPAPEDNWVWVWPDLHTPSDQEKAEVARTRTEALTKYADSPNASMIIAPRFFMEKWLEMTDEEIEQNEGMLETYKAEVAKELEDETARIEQEAIEAAEEEEFEEETGA